MAVTNFGLLTDEQKTTWSMDFWSQARNLSFINKFLGKSENSVIQHITELKKSEKGARAEAQADARTATSQILEAERFELAVAKLEADYSTLNPKSETYDPELIEMILDRQARLVQGGMPPSQAITSATDFVMKRVARDETPAQQGLAAAKVPDRKAEQVKKNLEVQAKQPPSMKDVGLDSDKLGEKAMPNVAQMTLEEFNALPAATKARLRGDTL